MDCAMGGELGAYIKEKHHLTEDDAIRIFKQIHDAVRYIHSRNVVHRDIKPNNILFLDEKHENIIVIYSFNFKLIDFGISGVCSGNIKENIKLGTTRFIPPELASGLSYTDW